MLSSALLIPSRFLPAAGVEQVLWRIKIAIGRFLPIVGVAPRGYWFWDMRTMELCWDNNMEAIYGLPRSPGGYRVGTYDSLFAVALWDDLTRSIVNHNVELAMNHHSVLQHDFRVRDRATGELKIVRGVGRWIYDSNRAPLAMYGYNTAHHLTPEDLRAVGSALTLEELTHAASHPGCPTPDPSTIAAAIMVFIQCSGAFPHAK